MHSKAPRMGEPRRRTSEIPSVGPCDGYVPQAMPERLRSHSAVAAREGTPRRKVLLYGDSLTAGYYDDGDKFAPYGLWLAESLAADLDIEVWSCGLSGRTAEEMASGACRGRSITDVVKRKGQGLEYIFRQPGADFDLVLLMAGTNDLAKSEDTEEMFEFIRALHRLCHAVGGARTVALAVPPNRPCLRDANYCKDWKALNSKLGAWARGVGAEEGVALFVETADLVPYDIGSELWEDDGLHFSPAGSERLGRSLAPLLASLLSEPVPPLNPLPAPRGHAPWPAGPMPLCFSSPAPDGTPRPRILAFGDSLTAGYRKSGCLFSPYGASLCRDLLPAFSADVWVCGLSGLTAAHMAGTLDQPVQSDVVNRKGSGLRTALLRHGPFDLALIMAGTNDLETTAPRLIAKSIQEMHMACHREGVRTVALGVPSSAVTTEVKKFIQRRREVNDALRMWADETDAVAAYVETGDMLPFDDDNGLFEPDGLHFSEMGSEKLGELLAPIVSRALSP